MNEHFLHVLNVSLTSGVFPDEWKKAKITPIPKINNPTRVTDLRPISLLPITGKILEKFVHKQSMAFVEGNQLFTDCQNGFRSKRGTQDTVIR